MVPSQKMHEGFLFRLISAETRFYLHHVWTTEIRPHLSFYHYYIIISASEQL